VTEPQPARARRRAGWIRSPVMIVALLVVAEGVSLGILGYARLGMRLLGKGGAFLAAQGASPGRALALTGGLCVLAVGAFLLVRGFYRAWRASMDKHFWPRTAWRTLMGVGLATSAVGALITASVPLRRVLLAGIAHWKGGQLPDYWPERLLGLSAALLIYGLLLVGVGVVYRSYRARPARLSTAFFLATLLLMGYALITAYRGVGGTDYAIYTYFSRLHFQGTNPYHAPPLDPADLYRSYSLPALLDYPGAQLLIYNACYWITQHTHADGLVLYSVLLLLAALICAYELVVRAWIAPRAYAYFLVLCLVAPGLWFTLLAYTYEDKALYILMPLALLYAWGRWRRGAFLLLGVLTGLTGVVVALAPVLAWADWREVRAKGAPRPWRRLLGHMACLAFGAAVALAPFFPDSLISWQRRAALEASGPLWFSFWNLIPNYPPNLNKLVMALACLAIYACFYAEIIDLKAALVLLIAVFFFFSSILYLWRVVPLVVVLVLVYRREATHGAFFAVALAYLYGAVFFFRDYPKPSTVKLETLALLAPLILGVILVALDSIDRARLRRAEEDSAWTGPPSTRHEERTP
jgi:hypothetical protein